MHWILTRREVAVGPWPKVLVCMETGARIEMRCGVPGYTSLVYECGDLEMTIGRYASAEDAEEMLDNLAKLVGAHEL